MCAQMMRVISSPSSSTTGFATLILSMNVLGWVRWPGYSERQCGRQSVNPRAFFHAFQRQSRAIVTEFVTGPGLGFHSIASHQGSIMKFRIGIFVAAALLALGPARGTDKAPTKPPPQSDGRSPRPEEAWLRK